MKKLVLFVIVLTTLLFSCKTIKELNIIKYKMLNYSDFKPNNSKKVNISVNLFFDFNLYKNDSGYSFNPYPYMNIKKSFMTKYDSINLLNSQMYFDICEIQYRLYYNYCRDSVIQRKFTSKKVLNDNIQKFSLKYYNQAYQMNVKIDSFVKKEDYQNIYKYRIFLDSLLHNIPRTDTLPSLQFNCK